MVPDGFIEEINAKFNGFLSDNFRKLTWISSFFLISLVIFWTVTFLTTKKASQDTTKAGTMFVVQRRKLPPISKWILPFSSWNLWNLPDLAETVFAVLVIFSRLPRNRRYRKFYTTNSRKSEKYNFMDQTNFSQRYKVWLLINLTWNNAHKGLCS